MEFSRRKAFDFGEAGQNLLSHQARELENLFNEH
jgi:hypothetical protein